MREDLEIIYWMFLAQTLGYASSKVKKVAKIYGSSFKFYSLGLNEWKLSGIFNEKEIFKLKNTKPETSEKILENCKNKNYKILPYSSEKYPNRLKEINNPPAVLYVKGSLPKIDGEILVAIVGTRSPSVYGKNVAFNFGYNLAFNKITIVSGGALGIDSTAQHGAVMASGRVISVLGCGFDCRYPVKNEKLREEIIKDGALVSEYPPDLPAIPRNFPIRNRIISALSLGVLVVEAGEKSGALITAEIAKKQHKDIFAIPGNINNSYSIGPNNLIKSGAILVTKIEDILGKYKSGIAHSVKPKNNGLISLESNKTSQNSFENLQENIISKKREKEKNNLNLVTNNSEQDLSRLSKNELIVYNLLDDEPLTLDELIVKSNLNVPVVIKCVTGLEILGLIKCLPGGMYQRN